MKIYLIFGFLIQIVASACPNGWLIHDGNCYHFSHDVESWTGAYSMCKILGGQLLEINGAAENQFVSSQVKISGRDYWIGLSDVNEEGSWIWMTSMAKLSYSNWSPGEPTATNVNHDIENCVMIYKTNGMWNDLACLHTNFYICEKI
ncbi:perlucin-like protein [Ruditapes philippinarum]|uniref:perlucin-like protein n=1 Tax=Ruditapes philippinarum TaxID=129788 RepID=UPI00295C247E|nr:perlucin-like protein [Ruditapes philippinarum]